ncbi:hypothetical protein ACKGJO_06875 [Gracilimonas sp. Q87]|uniref:hypothetical protein n=1 Tax=Gracilimonas sp. Q87 TaxID=3384766 RepID=UPI0039844012
MLNDKTPKEIRNHFSDLETVEIENEKQKLLSDADLIEHQLELAKAREAETGEKYYRSWYTKAKYAMKCKRRQASIANNIIGFRNNQDDKEKQNALKLLRIIKDEIGTTQFANIMNASNTFVYVNE